MNYLSHLYQFYNNRKEIKQQYPDLEISFLVKLWMVTTTCFGLMVVVNSIPLFLQQMYYIYNDVTYHEYIKKPNMESSCGVCISRNEDKFVSI